MYRLSRRFHLNFINFDNEIIDHTRDNDAINLCIRETVTRK